MPSQLSIPSPTTRWAGSEARTDCNTLEDCIAWIEETGMRSNQDRTRYTTSRVLELRRRDVLVGAAAAAIGAPAAALARAAAVAGSPAEQLRALLDDIMQERL